MALRSSCGRICPLVAGRCFSQSSVRPPSAAAAAPKPVDPLAKVSGLTEKVVGKVAESERGGNYKVPEYFRFNRFSYHEAEIELGPFRCAQPNANRKQ